MRATWKVLDKATRHLDRKARFPDPTRTRDRNETDILTQQ
jgi:hypothetical protein